jgi:hypothetical protein
MTPMDVAWYLPGSGKGIWSSAVGTNEQIIFDIYFWTPKIPPIFRRKTAELGTLELETIVNPPHDALDTIFIIPIGLGVQLVSSSNTCSELD